MFYCSNSKNDSSSSTFYLLTNDCKISPFCNTVPPEGTKKNSFSFNRNN